MLVWLQKSGESQGTCAFVQAPREPRRAGGPMELRYRAGGHGGLLKGGIVFGRLPLRSLLNDLPQGLHEATAAT